MLNTNFILLQVVSLKLQFVIFEKSAKKNLHCFCKTLYCRYLAESWRLISSMLKILNIAGLKIWLCFYICQGSVYTRALNVPGLWTYHSLEYARVLNILGLYRPLNEPEYPWIIPEYGWLCLIMAECWTLAWPYCGCVSKVAILPHLKKVQKKGIIFMKRSMAQFWQIHEYAWDPEYSGVLKLALVLNMPGIFISTAGVIVFCTISFNIL